MRLILLSVIFLAGLQANANPRCAVSDKLGLEKVKVDGKETFTNKGKTVSLTLSCPTLSAKEIDELLAVFPERVRVEKHVSFQPLKSAGDSLARIYFDTSNGKLTQLAVVSKSANSAEVEKLALDVLKSAR